MTLFRNKSHDRNVHLADRDGFTIVEILVAIAVCAVVAVGTVSTYVFLLKTYRGHKDFTVTHTKLRGCMALMQLDFQAAGRSGLQSANPGNTGVTDICRYDLAKALDPNGNPAVTYTTLMMDRNGSGFIDDRDLPGHSVTYRLIDFDGDNRPDLTSETIDLLTGVSTGDVLVARGVDGLSIAYAVDNDRDGVIDRNPADTGTMWCIDTNNDNQLDSHLDANGDGAVNELDDADRDGFIDVVAIPGGVQVPRTRIRQIKMWILVRSDLSDVTQTHRPANLNARRGYVVGHTVVWEPGDGFRRRVITVGVTLRNTEGELQL